MSLNDVDAQGGPESDEVGAGGRAPEEDEGSGAANPHTSAEEGHPAGPGERSDRDVGGPTSPDEPGEGDAEGGAPGASPGSGFEPHE